MNRFQCKRAIAWYKARGIPPARVATGPVLFRDYQASVWGEPYVRAIERRVAVTEAITRLAMAASEFVTTLVRDLAEISRPLLEWAQTVDWEAVTAEVEASREARAFALWAREQGFEPDAIEAGVAQLRRLSPEQKAQAMLPGSTGGVLQLRE